MNKNIRNLLIIFAVLLIVFYLFFRKGDKQTTQDIDEKLFTVDSAKIEKIEIIRNSGPITLEKMNGVWMLTQPIHYPADTTTVTALLSTLQNFKIESEISSNPAKYNTYLDSVNNPRVTVWQGGEVAGSFILGNQAMGGTNAYIQREQGQPILLASNLLQYHFTRDVSDYRDKKILSIPLVAVNSITFSSDDTVKYQFTMVKDPNTAKWMIDNDTVQDAQSTTFLNQLNNVQTESFIDSAITELPPLTYQIQVRGAQNADINFHKVKSSETYFIVKTSLSENLYKMSTGYAGMYIKARRDFIPEAPKTTTQQPVDDKKKTQPVKIR